MRDLGSVRIEDYKPSLADFECRRCQRRVSRTKYALIQKFGNLTMGELARLVAANGRPPCNLAADTSGNVLCNVTPVEPPVENWADLSHALYGGWECLLYCERRHASLKAAKSCPGPMKLDVRSLVAVLGFDLKLSRLYRTTRCPGCGSEAFSIRWVIPKAPPPPEPTASFEDEHLYRVAHESKRRLRAIKGDRRD